jgi:Zn finger protein HypA/HybF involved in hydrogenase expression|tara:strand:+ start:381 stop:608 length:228 start_codon:yes stop_codon:yes gene_type:complete
MNMAFKSWVMDEQIKEEEEQLMKKEAESKDKAKKAKKKCLTCNNPFESKGKFNRVCNDCKRTEYWGTGNDYRVIV